MYKPTVWVHCSVEVGGRGHGVDEDIILRQLLDVLLQLRQLLLAGLLLLLLADGVDLLNVGDLLVLLVDHLPFLLKGCDEFLALIVCH